VIESAAEENPKIRTVGGVMEKKAISAYYDEAIVRIQNDMDYGFAGDAIFENREGIKAQLLAQYAWKEIECIGEPDFETNTVLMQKQLWQGEPPETVETILITLKQRVKEDRNIEMMLRYEIQSSLNTQMGMKYTKGILEYHFEAGQWDATQTEVEVGKVVQKFRAEIDSRNSTIKAQNERLLRELTIILDNKAEQVKQTKSKQSAIQAGLQNLKVNKP
jgi:hypothetical protein